jgi:hypothetical protein
MVVLFVVVVVVVVAEEKVVYKQGPGLGLGREEAWRKDH